MVDESKMPMPVPESLTPKVIIPSSAATTQAAINPTTGEPRRPRGRPAGGGRPRIPDGGINPPMEFNTGRGRSKPTTPTDGVSDDEKKQLLKNAKKQREEEYSQYILNDLNEKLFMLIASIPNSPFSIGDFYKEGHIPPKVQQNNNFSDLGNSIGIPVDVANNWGKLLAELSYTDRGKKVEKLGENNALTIGLAALGAIYSTYRYALTMRPILELVKNTQVVQRENEDGDTNSNTST